MIISLYVHDILLARNNLEMLDETRRTRVRHDALGVKIIREHLKKKKKLLSLKVIIIRFLRNSNRSVLSFLGKQMTYSNGT